MTLEITDCWKKGKFLPMDLSNLAFLSFVIESCLAAFTSPVCNLDARKKILGLLNSCLRHESCARDLFLKHNLSTWLAVIAHVSF
jgi:hypothetical protein